MLLVILLAAIVAIVAAFIVGWTHTEIEMHKELEEAAWNREMCNFYREED